LSTPINKPLALILSRLATRYVSKSSFHNPSWMWHRQVELASRGLTWIIIGQEQTNDAGARELWSFLANCAILSTRSSSASQNPRLNVTFNNVVQHQGLLFCICRLCQIFPSLFKNYTLYHGIIATNKWLGNLRRTVTVYRSLSRVRKIVTSDFELRHVSVRPSVLPHGVTGPPMDEFSWNLYLRNFRKFVEKIKMSLKSGPNFGYFIWREMYIYEIISLTSPLNQIFFLHNLYIKLKHAFCIPLLFPENRAFGEITWKNMIDLDTTNVTIF